MKNIVDKCKDWPKMFYRYINRKLKVQRIYQQSKNQRRNHPTPKRDDWSVQQILPHNVYNEKQNKEERITLKNRKSLKEVVTSTEEYRIVWS